MAVRIYGGGGGGAYSEDATATKAQVLEGFKAVTSDSNDEAVAGTMKDNKKVERTLNCGGAIDLSGYYAAGSKITANSLAQQTQANAAAAYILKGKTAWVNGQKITGTLTVSGVTSFKVTVVNYNTVTCEWVWGSDSKLYSGVAIRYNASSTAPTAASGGTKGYTGIGTNKTGTSTCTITGLKENTVYSFALFTYLSTSAGTFYSDSKTVLNTRTPFQYYTATVYDGSKFSDFMKSGVNNLGYMNTQYASSNVFSRTNLGLPQGYVNTSFGPSPITSGSLWMDHSDEGGHGYDGGHAQFVSRDQINFSKFKSITISGTHFMNFYCNDPVSLTYDPYISIYQSDSNTGDEQNGNRITRDIYTDPPKKIISSDDGGGGYWSGEFTLTFDISSWTTTNKYLQVYLRTNWNECLDYGDGGRGGMTITKIVFNV